MGYQNICITGASGWIGKETIDLLFRSLGSEFQNRVTLVSSDGKTLVLHSEQFKTVSWDNFIQSGNYDLLIHLAFLNQDKLEDLGTSLFQQINRKLTSDILAVAARNPSGSILAASSGAARGYVGNLNSKNPYEVYSGIKNEMESNILNSCSFVHIGLMRIWNISGVHANIQAPYALSSYISQALCGDTIEVRGAEGMLRTYVNAQEMIWVYLMALGNFDKLPLDSGGFETTLLALAELVASKMGGKRIITVETTQPSALARYIPESTVFNSLAKDLSLELSTLEQQVDMMVRFHSVASSSFIELFD